MSSTNLTRVYSDLPVFNRLGCGCYSYMFVIDDSIFGVKKFEVLADSVELALGVLSVQFGDIANFNYVNTSTLSVMLYNYPEATCLLWLV